MRNRDMPAGGIPDGELTRGPDSMHVPGALGLTKLEFAAIAAMKGMLAGNEQRLADTDSAFIARCACIQANALFDDLDGAMSETVTLGDATVSVNVGYGDVVTCTVCGGPPGSCSRNIDDCPHR